MSLDDVWLEEEKVIEAGDEITYITILRLVRWEESGDSHYWHATADQKRRALEMAMNDTGIVRLVLENNIAKLRAKGDRLQRKKDRILGKL